MVHCPVYRGIIHSARTLSQDLGRAKVGLLRPQSRFLAGRKIEAVHPGVEAIIERCQHEECEHC